MTKNNFPLSLAWCVSSILAFGLTGCGYLGDSRMSVTGPPDEIFSKTQLSYSYIKQELFLKRCEGCHGGVDPARGVALETYEQVINNLSGIIRTSLQQKTMPPKRGPLSDREMNLLRTWIAAGSPLGEGGPSPKKPEPTPTPVPSGTPVDKADFEYIRTVLFKNHACYKCHVAGERASDVPIDTVEALIDPEYKVVVPGRPQESKLIDNLVTLGRNRMPPISSGAGMSEAEVKLISDWISRGAPAKE